METQQDTAEKAPTPDGVRKRGRRLTLNWVMVGSALGICVTIAAGTTAFASIPASDTGIISACRNKTSGAVRIIDYQAGKRCTSAEAAVSWNSRGPASGPGPSPMVYVRSSSVNMVADANTTIPSVQCDAGDSATAVVWRWSGGAFRPDPDAAPWDFAGRDTTPGGPKPIIDSTSGFVIGTVQGNSRLPFNGRYDIRVQCLDVMP